MTPDIPGPPLAVPGSRPLALCVWKARAVKRTGFLPYSRDFRVGGLSTSIQALSSARMTALSASFADDEGACSPGGAGRRTTRFAF